MIRELHLRNFKCFEDQVFRLRHLTLLTGLNGAGKSTVLQALLLLRQSYQQSLLQTEEALALNGDLVYIGTGRDALFESAKQEEIGFDLTVENETGINVKTQWSFESFEDSDILPVAGFSVPADSEVYKTSLFTKSFHYLQAEHLGPQRFFEASKIAAQYGQLGSKGEYTASFLSHAQDNSLIDKRLMHPAARSDSLQHQAEAWLREISPGVRIDLTAIPNVGIVDLRYAFDMGNQVSNNYRSMNVGFGITYVLPVIVSVLSSTPGTLLLIENPESHLHPKGQSTIGRFLSLAASCGIQILVETHSDHMLNGVRIAVHDGELKPEDMQIHFFQKREQDGRCEVISPQIDRDGRLDFWPEGFFDEFDKNLDVLMQPRKE